MAAVILKTFLDIQTAVINEIKEQVTDTPVLTRVKRLINMVYRQKVAVKRDWPWLQTTIDDTLEIALTTGNPSCNRLLLSKIEGDRLVLPPRQRYRGPMGPLVQAR